MKFRTGNLRFRRLGWLDGIAVAILGCLLVVHLLHLALALMAKGYVLAEAKYALDRRFDVVWAGDDVSMEIDATLRGAMPRFRQRQPVRDVEEEYMIVTAIVRGDVVANSYFEDLTGRLTTLARKKYTVGAYDIPISLSELRVTPYPWFKPLDFAAGLVLLGSILAWVFTDGRLNERPGEAKGSRPLRRAQDAS